MLSGTSPAGHRPTWGPQPVARPVGDREQRGSLGACGQPHTRPATDAEAGGDHTGRAPTDPVGRRLLSSWETAENAQRLPRDGPGGTTDAVRCGRAPAAAGRV